MRVLRISFAGMAIFDVGIAKNSPGQGYKLRLAAEMIVR